MAEFISPYARAIQPTGYQYQYPLAVAAPVPKPSIWESYRQALIPNVPEAVSPVQSAVAGLRGNLESAALASILGLIQGRFGTLDVAGKYPVDGILAALLYVMSVKDSGKPDGFASDLRTLSQTCTSVAVFRKTAEWSRPKTLETSAVKDSPTVMSGHNSKEDPLVTAARKFGFDKAA